MNAATYKQESSAPEVSDGWGYLVLVTLVFNLRVLQERN